MIWSSSYWKEELLRLTDTLEQRRRQRRFSERSLAKLEKEIFFAFYAIRKLIEGKKLTQKILHSSIPVEAYPSTGKGVTFLNFQSVGFEIEKYFRVTKKTREKVSLSFLCNQVIHSYIYFNEFYGDRLTRICISSDRMRNQKLYSVKIAVIESILKRIALDNVHKIEATYDPKIGDYVVKNN